MGRGRHHSNVHVLLEPTAYISKSYLAGDGIQVRFFERPHPLLDSQIEPTADFHGFFYAATSQRPPCIARSHIWAQHPLLRRPRVECIRHPRLLGGEVCLVALNRPAQWPHLSMTKKRPAACLECLMSSCWQRHLASRLVPHNIENLLPTNRVAGVPVSLDSHVWPPPLRSKI
ncbi:hypothetical protein GGTG_09437 [Gaeumannomyces tritici R3-111a-1]|uniref:Uncharacterized protein n=1 Tax=Gaeumannomyces tritici (strain R3-111a-1) TaxID=644352 RepID=J3P7E5_GAET3|nr:hypothetical protein GGTG_09437 [Gaeumannomyces tritici R3-111a-1]EJT72576.1 hypothetical protein GGTG_09437 [Gaeumannomyces tritici R3-111a-1]